LVERTLKTCLRASNQCQVVIWVLETQPSLGMKNV
jgi:hypothetical protein